MKLTSKIILATLAIFATFATPVKAEETASSDWYNKSEDSKQSDLLYMDLKNGTVIIKMLPELAPNHVARIKELVKEGFYNGLSFHRVIPGFMAQGGDPTGTGAGGTGMKLKAEFSNLHHKRGTVSMARSGDPNSADSQFFICFDNADWLDGQYTIWGEVISGMEYVDMIKKGDPNSGAVPSPDKIVKMYLSE